MTSRTSSSAVPGSNARRPVPRLHILTNDDVVSHPDFAQQATELLHTLGPLTALHLRTRLLSGSAYCRLAEQLLDASETSGALLVINDRVDVALAIGASAVQLGSASLTPADVARIAPSLQLGVSVHNAETARELVAQAPTHVAWVMIGHIYDTPSHPDSPGHGPGIMSAVLQAVSTPIIAVGGIRPEHVTPLLQAGATGVAVISGIWSERTPKDSAMRYLSSLW